MSRRLPLGLGLLLLAACQSEPTVVMVTVAARSTVREPASLRVEVANGTGSRQQSFELHQDFPVTFTVTPTGRSGDLQIAVQALDDDDVVVAAAAGAVTIVPESETEITLTLDPLDFVLNEDIVGDQILASGRTLAARPSGGFLAVWSSCGAAACDIMARLFDDATAPLVNGTSMNRTEFEVDASDDDAGDPVVAASTDGFLVAWSAGSPATIRAATLDGVATRESGELVLSTAASAASAPAVAPLADGGTYVVVWEQARPDRGAEIRARLVAADGTLGTELLIDGGPAESPSLVALPDGGFAVAWVETNAATFSSLPYVCLFAPDGAPAAAGPRRASPYTIGSSQMPSLAVVDGRLWLAWQASALSDAYPLLASRPLVARRVGLDGELLSDLVILEETTQASDAVPVLAAYTHRLALVWADCSASDCDVRLRLFHPSGLALGGPRSLALDGTQRTPALVGLADSLLVAWSDDSRRAPDVNGVAVRARAVYPELELHDGSVGANCNRGDEPCEDGTTCIGTTFGVCVPACDLPDGTACPAGGVCTGGGCVFE